MSHQELRDELHHAGENHDEDGVPVKFPEHHEGDQKPGAHAELEGVREADGRQEDQESGGEDEGDDSRAQAVEDAPDRTDVTVLEEDAC